MIKFVQELKNKFCGVCDVDKQHIYNKYSYDSCVELWANELKDEYYIEFFKNVTTTQLDLDDGVFVLFRYAQGCDFDFDPLIRQCRSIVIDVMNEKIVLYPFDKFFNINEREETSFENIERVLSTAIDLEVTDKLDGSMQCARWYNNRLVMSGSQSLSRENSWRLNKGYSFVENDNNILDLLKAFPDTTFIFEFIDKEDAHVVIYDENESGMYLIGARDVNTGKHWSYTQLLVNAKLYNVKHTNIEHIYNLQDLMNNRSKYKASEKEGYVLRILKEDSTDFFVKIKCEDYLNVHRILSSIRSDKMVIQAVVNNTQDDLLSIIPNEYKEEITDKLKIIYNYINELKKLTEEAVELCKGYSDDEKERQIWITNNINSLYASCVRKALRNQPYSFVRENSKLKDMISLDKSNFYKKF